MLDRPTRTGGHPQASIIRRFLLTSCRKNVHLRRPEVRSGMALYKLYLTSPVRHSEDIDLLQVESRPVDPQMDGQRNTLDPWLGEARWNQSRDRVTFGRRKAGKVPAGRAAPSAGGAAALMGLTGPATEDSRLRKRRQPPYRNSFASGCDLPLGSQGSDGSLSGTWSNAGLG